MARKKNDEMTFEEFKEEVKEGNVTGVDAGELSPFAAMLKENSDTFEAMVPRDKEELDDIDAFCNFFKYICEESGFWDSRRKEYYLRLHRAGKTELAFIMIWNWILAGIQDKNFTAR